MMSTSSVIPATLRLGPGTVKRYDGRVMREQDKSIARWALQRKRLSIDQVEQIAAEAGKTGRSFRDVAVGRGLLSAQDFKPPPPMTIQPFYVVLLVCSFLIFAGLLAATVIKMRERSSKDDDLAIDTEKARTEADRRAGEASRGYKRAVISTNEMAARAELDKARDAMARADQMIGQGALPNLVVMALNEAFVGYNMYLKEMPDDAPVRVERARTHEMRRNYDLAIADLERAIQIDPKLQAALKPRIDQLRLFVAKKPQ
jgi:tetratricopeptide (TPR) repeat protein